MLGACSASSLPLSAGMSWTRSPQPHALVWFGLLNTNCEASSIAPRGDHADRTGGGPNRCALMVGKPGVAGLEIGVRKGGCAGMKYTLTWADTVARFDEVVEDRGATVLIDLSAVLYLIGT